MNACKICKKESNLIPEHIGVCLSCIREHPAKAIEIVSDTHRESRRAYGLPEFPPKVEKGVRCNLCVNECIIPDGEMGYCGLRSNVNGRLRGVSSLRAKVSWYYDPLPTNCVADWVCAGGTGAGYPEYAYSRGPEYGYKNLAVFFHACSLNCLYCQNWHFKEETLRDETVSIERFISAVTEDTSCICFFGGDPSPQLPFALRASRLALKHKRNRILRICFETNGTMNPSLLKKIMELALETGGTVKFDLKAWDDALHRVLTGITNKRTIENFRLAAGYIKYRREPPLLVASTLLVPGYIDEEEIESIARFISSLDPEIPYSLLAFYPHFYIHDLPLLKRKRADKLLQIAQDAGLRRVRLGNIHLLK